MTQSRITSAYVYLMMYCPNVQHKNTLAMTSLMSRLQYIYCAVSIWKLLGLKPHNDGLLVQIALLHLIYDL